MAVNQIPHEKNPFKDKKLTNEQLQNIITEFVIDE